MHLNSNVVAYTYCVDYKQNKGRQFVEIDKHK